MVKTSFNNQTRVLLFIIQCTLKDLHVYMYNHTRTIATQTRVQFIGNCNGYENNCTGVINAPESMVTRIIELESMVTIIELGVNS